MAPYVIAVITVASHFSYLLRLSDTPYMTTSLYRIALLAISFPLIYHLEKKHLVPAMELGDEKIWRYALPVPMILSLVCVFFVDVTYEQEGVPPKALFGMLFVFFGCLFTCYFLLKALKEVREKTEASERERQSRQLLAIQAEQYALLSKNIEATREARHDLRHHLAAIMNLIESEEPAKLKAYVSDYMEISATPGDLLLCKNHVVNSLAGHYIRLAKQQGIKVTATFGVESESPVSDLDLCVLVGNSLENAIEACVRMETGERSIHISAKVFDGSFSFTCDNSFDGLIFRDGEDYLSRKRDSREKGVGLSSIAAVVQKYDGQMRVEYTEDTFMLSVLLMV